MRAVQISNLLKNNVSRLEKDLAIIFKNKNLKIKEVKVLREKLIIKKDYKISLLVSLENNEPEKLILEIHDNKDYFQRNVFALKNFKTEKVSPPIIYSMDEKKKIIYREYLVGEFVYDLILKGKWKEKEITEFIQTTAEFASFLHNFKFKKKPRFLLKKVNWKIEKIILNQIFKFIKPNIENLRPVLKKNLTILLKKIDYLERKNEKCLIHGDYQLANFMISPEKKLRVMDFDTVELRNPARDLGRFLAQLEKALKFQERKEKFENLFLNYYLKTGKKDFYPDLKTNINVYKAEMIYYMILARIWGEKVPSPEEIKELLDYQTLLLK